MIFMLSDTIFWHLLANFIRQDPADQPAIDKVMLDLDGTENKTNLGANAILGAAKTVGENHGKTMKVMIFIGESSA